MHRPQALIAACLLLPLGAGTAPAQDVRGLEVCTAEKQMERRTGCLQANTEFLQRALRDARQQLGLATGDAAAAKRETAALKSDLAALKGEVAALKEAFAKLQAQVQELQAARK